MLLVAVAFSNIEHFGKWVNVIWRFRNSAKRYNELSKSLNNVG